MSSNLNLVVMQGNVTRDTELRYTPSGDPVATINLATNREWKDAEGQKHEKVVFTKWPLWGKRAEGLTQYLVKGTGLILTGRLEPAEAYADKEGKPAASLRVTVDEVFFQTGKRAGEKVATEVGDGPAPDDPEGETVLF